MNETATLAGGCFWCTEAIFKRLKGVISVTPGYSGGQVHNPSYEQVCSGETGHAEAIQIMFDPKKNSFENILKVFFDTHDPKSLNRQGDDTGTQYRSAIFYHNENQKTIAEKMKNKLDPIVTEIVAYKKFYPAEDYHKNYFEKNQDAPYCKYIIQPKVSK